MWPVVGCLGFLFYFFTRHLNSRCCSPVPCVACHTVTEPLLYRNCVLPNQKNFPRSKRLDKRRPHAALSDKPLKPSGTISPVPCVLDTSNAQLQPVHWFARCLAASCSSISYDFLAYSSTTPLFSLPQNVYKRRHEPITAMEVAVFVKVQHCHLITIVSLHPVTVAQQL